MQYPPATLMMPSFAPPPTLPPYATPPYAPPPYATPPFATSPFAPSPFFGYYQTANSPMNSPMPQGNAVSEENKTIWAGDLHYWMDENYLHSCFRHTGEVIAIKVIRNKQTGKSEGYGFVEFLTHLAAEKVIQDFTGIVMPNTDQPFRLNWASFSMGDKRSDIASDHSIFVGDLAPDVTDTLLQETFSSKYPSVKGAKVVFDANTGCSKGYGFVRFGNDSEKVLAMTEMNGVYCSSRPMRIGAATPRKLSGGSGSSSASSQGSAANGDSTNTTVFVGGLDQNVSEDDLKQVFSKYGDLVSIKIPVGKQCGFVQFVQRNNAEEALEALNGTMIGKQSVRLSWGRNPTNKQMRFDPVNRWSGGYYGGRVYRGYGFPMPVPVRHHHHHPGMYAAPAAYGPFPMYGFQQQVS